MAKCEICGRKTATLSECKCGDLICEDCIYNHCTCCGQRLCSKCNHWCSECGEGFCRDCLVKINGELYCDNCADALLATAKGKECDITGEIVNFGVGEDGYEITVKVKKAEVDFDG